MSSDIVPHSSEMSWFKVSDLGWQILEGRKSAQFGSMDLEVILFSLRWASINPVQQGGNRCCPAVTFSQHRWFRAWNATLCTLRHCRTVLFLFLYRVLEWFGIADGESFLGGAAGCKGRSSSRSITDRQGYCNSPFQNHFYSGTTFTFTSGPLLGQGNGRSELGWTLRSAISDSVGAPVTSAVLIEDVGLALRERSKAAICVRCIILDSLTPCL